jgi:hypothetical protein
MNKTFNANNPQFNACVGNNGGYGIETYVHGYADTVEILLKSIIDDGTLIDPIIYPMVYSARHYLELMLKHLIDKLEEINTALYVPVPTYSKLTHSINTLWNIFSALSEADIRLPSKISILNEYVLDYSQIDDTGETFRYPLSGSSNKHLVDQHCINIRDFGIRFLEMKEIFEELSELIYLINNETRLGSNVRGFSRNIIEKITNDLPKKADWTLPEFESIKEEIKNKFSISSNRIWNEIINLILKHYDFSNRIGLELPIKSITPKDLNWFSNEFNNFITRTHEEGSNYFSLQEAFYKKLDSNFSKLQLASLSQLYDMGYFNLYPEEFDVGVNFKLKSSKNEIIRFNLPSNAVVITQIIKGLKIIFQNTLLNSLKDYKEPAIVESSLNDYRFKLSKSSHTKLT